MVNIPYYEYQNSQTDRQAGRLASYGQRYQAQRQEYKSTRLQQQLLEQQAQQQAADRYSREQTALLAANADAYMQQRQLVSAAQQAALNRQFERGQTNQELGFRREQSALQAFDAREMSRQDHQNRIDLLNRGYTQDQASAELQRQHELRTLGQQQDFTLGRDVLQNQFGVQSDARAEDRAARGDYRQFGLGQAGADAQQRRNQQLAEQEFQQRRQLSGEGYEQQLRRDEMQQLYGLETQQRQQDFSGSQFDRELQNRQQEFSVEQRNRQNQFGQELGFREDQFGQEFGFRQDQARENTAARRAQMDPEAIARENMMAEMEGRLETVRSNRRLSPEQKIEASDSIRAEYLNKSSAKYKPPPTLRDRVQTEIYQDENNPSVFFHRDSQGNPVPWQMRIERPEQPDVVNAATQAKLQMDERRARATMYMNLIKEYDPVYEMHDGLQQEVGRKPRYTPEQADREVERIFGRQGAGAGQGQTSVQEAPPESNAIHGNIGATEDFINTPGPWNPNDPGTLEDVNPQTGKPTVIERFERMADERVKKFSKPGEEEAFWQSPMGKSLQRQFELLGYEGPPVLNGPHEYKLLPIGAEYIDPRRPNDILRKVAE